MAMNDEQDMNGDGNGEGEEVIPKCFKLVDAKLD